MRWFMARWVQPLLFQLTSSPHAIFDLSSMSLPADYWTKKGLKTMNPDYLPNPGSESNCRPCWDQLTQPDLGLILAQYRAKCVFVHWAISQRMYAYEDLYFLAATVTELGNDCLVCQVEFVIIVQHRMCQGIFFKEKRDVFLHRCLQLWLKPLFYKSI